MRRRGKLLLQAASVGLVAVLIALFGWRLATNDHAANLSKEVAKGKSPVAPGFTLERLDESNSGKLSLASLRGKVVVLNFWASWCHPCKEESGVLERAWQRYKGQDVVVVGVDGQDVAGDAVAFAKRYGLTYPLVYDGPASLATKYGVSGFPETWFIDRDGKLVGQHIVGPATDQTLRTNIERALAST
ncbi:MAG TPA: redoxin domain-containing protein [Gaiellaceae bacterium]|jgi:cytochrome c biogenesis protein CcmG/thiol:disulfide interchange protein DsbE